MKPSMYKQWHTQVEVIPIEDIPKRGRTATPSWANIIADLAEGKAGRIVVGGEFNAGRSLQTSILASANRSKSVDVLSGYKVHTLLYQEGPNFVVYFWKEPQSTQ